MTSTSSPTLKFDHISVSFGQEVLFHELSLEIPGGKCTCILGPSGCGKSTLLRIVSGNSNVLFSGTISYNSSNSKPLKTAWMSQKDLLLPWLSLLDNVLLGAKLRGEENTETRNEARDLLEKAGLENYENALPSTLSGGMKQRGALLRTLMEKRPVLLMDEPFSALDALTRLKLQNLSARLTKGATVILVTHDPMEALRMGHKIIILSGKPGYVKSTVTLEDNTPRDVDHPDVQRHYSALLKSLMSED